MKITIKHLKTRIFILLCLSIGLLFLVFSVIIYHRYHSDLSAQIHSGMFSLARTAARTLDASLHDKILNLSSETTKEYLDENRKLMIFREANNEITYIYTLAIKQGNIIFVLDPTPPGDSDRDGIDDHSYIGQKYDDAPQKEIMLAFSGNETIARYTDRWGSFLSAFVPISHSGRVIGVLGLDMTQERFTRLERSFLIRIIAIMTLTALLLIFVSYYITSIFIKPVLQLAESVRSLDLDNHHSLSATEIHHELEPFVEKINRFLYMVRKELGMRKEAERALKQSEQKFRELTDFLPQTIFECDINGRLTFVNKFGFQNFKYSIEEMEKVINVIELIVPEDRERAMRNMADIIIHGKNTEANEYRVIRKDESVIPVLIYSSPIISNGVINGFRGIIIDITERKKAEENLRQAQKMEILGNLAGGVAHDFNNVLSGILGTISLMRFSLKEKKYDYAELSDDLAMLESASIRAADLVRQLLTLAKKQDLSMVPMDLNEAVRRVINICRNTMSKSIEIRLGKSPERAIARADINQVEQALLNLCINSSHAVKTAMEKNSGRKGLIEITLEEKEIEHEKHAINDVIPPGKYWRIMICDNGTGIAHDEFLKIFEPFYTTKSSGTGLGLTITKNIISKHGGFLDVTSEPEAGSVFYVYLACDAADRLHPIPSDRKSSPVPGKGGVLVVDDEEMVRTITAKMLEKCGYRTLHAENGKRAIELYVENHTEIDIVLLDIDMPGLSGPETLKQLMETDKNVRVLMMSGYKNEPVSPYSGPGSSAGFIQKPFTLAEISDVLASILGRDNGCR